MEKLKLYPDPRRIVEGLRDTGYEFNTAIADIIDNSIEAGADNIDIEIKQDLENQVVVTICDDGQGMNRDELINAMKYGSDTKKDNKTYLGKFGLGLKTASTAFCRSLSVVTRPMNSKDTYKATWDLDIIADSGDWELILQAPTQEEIQKLDSLAKGESGTLVIWEKVDRLFRTNSSISDRETRDRKSEKRVLQRIIDKLNDHLAMVFQRYLDPEDVRCRTITLRINGNKIEAFDPFCIKEVQRPEAEKTVEVINENGIKSSFRIKVFILPRKEEFRNRDIAEKARISNNMQGIYVYRQNRLIHGPDWLGMFAQEPHLTLLRVELSFPHDLDEMFQVDIKKSRIILNDALFEFLKNYLYGPRREAEKAYRDGNNKLLKENGVVSHESANNAIGQKAEELKSAEIVEINKNEGNVILKNPYGKTKFPIGIIEDDDKGECYVLPVDGITDGLLWEPAFVNGKQAVRINTSHPYYHKVYIPNRTSNVTIQGLDSLLWGLSVAELKNVNENNKTRFEDLRYEVSRILRRLVEDLPDPNIEKEWNGNV